jgi:hypothetical protein
MTMPVACMDRENVRATAGVISRIFVNTGKATAPPP